MSEPGLSKFNLLIMINKYNRHLIKPCRWAYLSFLVIMVQTITSHAVVFEADIGYGIGIPEFHFSNAPLAFSVYPWKYFGFSTGLENSMRKKIEKYENVEESINTINSYGDNLVFTYHFDKYSEELTTQILQVPVMLKFRSDYFYTAAGIKIGIPEHVRARMSYEGLRTEGCLPEFSLCLDNVEELGFTAHQDSSYEEKIRAKLLLMLAFECGARIKLSKHFALLLGAFADYSLNKGFDRGLQETVEWVEHVHEAHVHISDGWRKWQPWSAGGIVKLSFIFGGRGD